MRNQGIRRQALSDDLEIPDVRGARCFMPFVRLAESELASAQCARILSDDCVRKLLEGLLGELASCGQDVVDRRISKELEKHSFLYAFDIRLAPKALLDEAEAQVADLVEQSGWHALDHSAPLLHGVLARRTERFIATTKELCERVTRDRASLEKTFFDMRALGIVTDIDHGDADSHEGGRRTCVITCEAGSFVYKPHDCRIDEWFYRLVQKHLPGILRVPKVITRNDANGDYGFCEFLGCSDVSDRSGITRYWRRMGGACALFYLLGSQDLHGRNFVACAETPALVDIETVLSPEAAVLGDERTCPNVQHALGGFTEDLAKTLVASGIHATFDSDVGNLSPFFLRIASCLPVWNGREYDVAGFEDEVSAGFVESCETLLANGDELMRDLKSARELTVRWVVRPTDVYGKLLRRLCEADAYDACKRAEILSVLNRPFETAQPDGEHPLVASEIASLLEGDVPVFRVQAGSTTVQIGEGKTVEGLLAACAVDRALARLAMAGPPERGFALAVLDANLRYAEVEAGGEAACVVACELADEPLAFELAQEEAESVFARLESMSITSPSGCSAWLFRSYAQRTLTEPGNGFANGVWGMAPYFAALAQTTHNAELRARSFARLEMCLERISEVIWCLRSARRIPEESVSLGLASGFGGMLRALTLVRQISGELSIGNRAECLAFEVLALIGRLDVENAKRTSVYSGCAGLLLALCQCPCINSSVNAQDAVERLARRLVDMRTLRTNEGRYVWNTFERNWPISGFGNGIAGVGAALSLADSLGVQCGGAVREAFAWELGAYDDSLGTWPDFRKSRVANGYVHGICSGAPGVGLAAVMASCSGDRELVALARELRARADAACDELAPCMRDTLCCGYGSIVEYWFARSQLENDVRRAAAGRMLAGEVDRKNDVGHFIFQNKRRRQNDDPSLFFGLSGVGYNLLRYANPSLPGIIV